MTTNRRLVLLAVLTLAGLAIFTRPADAAPRADAACDPADQAQLTAVLSADGQQATFTVANTLPLCTPVDIGLAVYVKSADGFVLPQTLADSATGTITSGSVVLSITAPTSGQSPNCFTQFDAFTGPVLSQITGTEQYGPRLLTYAFGTTPNCVSGESTTTSSTTSTTSTTSTSSTTSSTSTTSTSSTTSTTRSTAAVSGEDTSTTAPVGVIGEVVEQSPPPSTSPAAEGGALARTGPRVDVRPWMTVAGLLFIIGGALTARATRSLPRRA